MQKVVRIGMFGEIRSHRANHGQVIDMLADVGKERADWCTALTMLFEFPEAAERLADIVELCRLNLHREGLAILGVKPWFGVPRIDLRWTAVHIEIDDAATLGREVTRANSERILGLTSFGRQHVVAAVLFFSQQCSQGHGTEATG